MNASVNSDHDSNSPSEHPALAELWKTMASVQAGLKLRQDEARADLQEVEAQRALAWHAMQKAELDGDQAAMDKAQKDLDTCDRIFQVLQHDLHDPSTPPEDPDAPDAMRLVKDPSR